MKSKNKIKQFFCQAASAFTPYIKNVVFFDSFAGQYNDNPKYISEKLHELAPDIKIIWSVSDHGIEKPPEYVCQVQTYSKEYYKYAYSAAVTVDNYTGLRSFGFVNKRINRLLSVFVKKRGQLSISTWHGTPLKTIGIDYKKCTGKLFCCGNTYMVAGCEYTKRILERAFPVNDRVRLYGTPRNDVLINGADPVALKRKLRIPENKKVILFAPTFRDSVEMSGLQQLKMFDIDRLLAALNKRFGGEFVFIFRVHHRVIEAIYSDDSKLTFGKNAINGNIGDDMAEYLACTDVLLTDYSGSLFDFAITGKPCFLFPLDLEQYATVERGIYMDYSELPFPQANDFESLLNRIDEFSEKDYSTALDGFQKKIGNAEKGLASRRIAEDIIHFIKAQNK